MTKKENGYCRQALATDIPTVARIHLNAFPGFFLTELGYKFVLVMYRAFLFNPAGLFVVYESNTGQVTGFAVGAMRRGKKDCWLAVRYLPQFLAAAFPVILQRPRKMVGRLAARFFKTSSSFELPNDAAVLRSIGVMPSERGSGAAAALLGGFERMAFRQGANDVYLTTDQDNNDRAQSFYKRHGYSVVEIFQQDGQRSMWLMSKLLKEDCS